MPRTLPERRAPCAHETDAGTPAIRLRVWHRTPVVAIRRDLASHELRTRNEARCERILESSRPLDLEDLPWEQAEEIDVDDAVIETLVYMRDVEGFTDSYLVGLGAHRTTVGDPLIGRFLDVWRTEEAGHAHAIDRFLTRYGSSRGRVIPLPQPAPPANVGWHERLLANIGGPVGTLVAATHMTWGAANELLTLNGYRLLADRCDHPLLAEMLRRIAAQESRHFSFYLLQAQWRLASSALARKVLRHVLIRAWTPVGIGEGYKSPSDFARLMEYLGGTEDGRRAVSRMDNRFAALPGLGGVRIFEAAASSLVAA